MARGAILFLLCLSVLRAGAQVVTINPQVLTGSQTETLGTAAMQNAASFSMGPGYRSQTMVVAGGTVVANMIVGANGASIGPPLSAASFGGIAATGGAVGTNIEIARTGNIGCIFDGPTTANDVVIPSSTTLGDCHDAGVAFQSLIPCTTPIVGDVAATTSVASTVTTRLHDVGTYGTLCSASVGTSAAFPSASIAAGASQTQTATVNGALTTNGCEVVPITNPGSTAIAFACYVTSANTITLYENNTNQAALGGAAVTPTATAVRYRVF